MKNAINKKSSLISSRLADQKPTPEQVDKKAIQCLKNGWLDDAFHTAKLGASTEVLMKAVEVFAQQGWVEGVTATADLLPREDW